MCKWLENKLHIYSLAVTVTASQDYFFGIELNFTNNQNISLDS